MSCRANRCADRFHFRTSGGAAGDKGAAWFERLDALVPRGRADVLDDDVDAFFVGDLADFVGNLLFVMVDPVIGAESAAFASFISLPAVVITRQWKSFAIWMAAMPTPELAPSTSTVCPGRTPARTDQHVPRGDKYEWHTGSLNEIERIRNRNHIGCSERRSVRNCRRQRHCPAR